MKFYNLKDAQFINLYGSDALGESGYNRLFDNERQLIRPINPNVSYLATNCAGIMAKFITDSPQIVVKTILNGKHDMSHMPATGQCGVDLYVYDELLQDYVFHDVSKYPINESQYDYTIGHFETKKIRRFILNLPLYMGAKDIQIGLDDDAKLYGDVFKNNGRIVVYGTSITQGGCVSRPGMLYTNLLSRWLDTEFLNFGFSGSAFAEKEIATIIASRPNQKLLIIDIEANAGIDEKMKQNLPAFIDEYKKYHPNIPIIVVSRILFSMDLFNSKRKELREFYNRYLKKFVNNLNKIGGKATFLDGAKFFKGNFTEYTVDGIHPNDLGSFAIAKAYYNTIKKILG